MAGGWYNVWKDKLLDFCIHIRDFPTSYWYVLVPVHVVQKVVDGHNDPNIIGTCYLKDEFLVIRIHFRDLVANQLGVGGQIAFVCYLLEHLFPQQVRR